VILPTHKLTSLQNVSELTRIGDVVRDTRQFSFGSAHPQGGNPWSADPRLGAVDDALGVHGFDNLFVCDASVFPSCIGVNPIETVLAIAKLASKRIFARA
jgi:choline dehydrogenase-like flavoprotein